MPDKMKLDSLIHGWSDGHTSIAVHMRTDLLLPTDELGSAYAIGC